MEVLIFKKIKLLVFVIMVLINYSPLFGQNNMYNPKEISFLSDGSIIHGWFYNASGNGPFSTVILLQGSVGNDGDILNLGESLSKEGFNVMTFNYPGAWRSEGYRTDESALESVQYAINFVKSEKSVQSFNNDTSEIILLGYSYGAGMALLGSVIDSTIKKVITIALGDLSVTAEQLDKDENARNSFERMVDGILSNPSMAKGTSGKEYVELLIKNKEKYNLKKHSKELAKKELLLLVGWQDNTKRIENDVMPLYRELQAKGANNVKIIPFETNHSFSNVQTELVDTIIKWLIKR